MMRIRVFLLACASIFLCGGGPEELDTNNNKQQIEQAGKRPYVIGYWKVAPSIKICEGAPVTLSRVNQAVEFWKKLGYEFGSVEKDDSVECSFTQIPNSIMIDLIGQEFIEPNLAMTKTLTSNKTKEIKMAKIFIKSTAANRARVLEHEIGHALGWRHFRQRYHLMNESWSDGGWKVTELKKENQIDILRRSSPDSFDETDLQTCEE